jgi:hypothetical protein
MTIEFFTFVVTLCALLVAALASFVSESEEVETWPGRLDRRSRPCSGFYPAREQCEGKGERPHGG